MVVQQKTGRPVQFEITSEGRASLLAWLQRRGGTVDDYAFPSRVDHTDHLSTRQYARLVDEWVQQAMQMADLLAQIGVDPSEALNKVLAEYAAQIESMSHWFAIAPSTS
jgi:hypothetical protein